MIAYKLCRQRKDGKITSLFINKKRELPFDEWLESENHPTKGFKGRPFWHCTANPRAPHLSMKERIWVMVEMEGFEEFQRPESQGGLWYLAKKIKLIDWYREFNRGDVVVCRYGYNNITKRPFTFLYEFGYYTKYGCVVYNEGERNMQDSHAFRIHQVHLATEKDKEEYYWGN